VLYNISGAIYAGLMQFDAAIDSYKKAIKLKLTMPMHTTIWVLS